MVALWKTDAYWYTKESEVKIILFKNVFFIYFHQQNFGPDWDTPYNAFFKLRYIGTGQSKVKSH